MKQVILDTSFIITCAKQKIDFFKYLEEEGMIPIIPEQTISELKALDAKLALKIIKIHNFNTVSVSGKDADNAIISFSKKNPTSLVATLDAELKKKIRNRKIIIKGKKKLEII